MLSALDAVGGFDGDAVNAALALVRDGAAAAVAAAGERELAPLLNMVSRNNLEALALLAERASDAVFAKHAKSWLDALAKHVKSGAPLSAGTADLLRTLLVRCKSSSELGRHASAACPALASSLLNSASKGKANAWRCLLAVAESSPGACGAVSAPLEKVLLENLTGRPSPPPSLPTPAVATLFAVSTRLGGAGREGAAHADRWAGAAARMVNTLDWLLDQLAAAATRGGETSAKGTRPRYDLPACAASENLLGVLGHLSRQVRKVCSCLVELLVCPFPYAKRCDLGQIVRLCERSLEVTASSSDGDDDLLRAHSAPVAASFARVLAAAAAVYRQDCMPYLPRIADFCASALEDARAGPSSTYLERRASNVGLRCCLLDLFGSCLSLGGHAILRDDRVPEVAALLLREVVPFQRKLSLVTPASKKRRQGKAAVESESSTPGVSFSPAPVALRALRCLRQLVDAGGELLPDKVLGNLATPALLALAADVCRRWSSARPPPGPFSDPAVRLELRRCLLSLALRPNPASAARTPVGLIANVFRRSLSSQPDQANLEFIRTALASLQAVTRPRSAPLTTATAPGLAEAAETAREAQRIHVYVLQDSTPGVPTSKPPEVVRKRPIVREEERSDSKKARSGVEDEDEKKVDDDGEVSRIASEYLDKKRQAKKGTVEVSDDDEVEGADVTVTEDSDPKLLDQFYNLSQNPIVVPEEVKNAEQSRTTDKETVVEEEAAAVVEGAKAEEEDQGVNAAKLASFFVMESSSSDEDE